MEATKLITATRDLYIKTTLDFLQMSVYTLYFIQLRNVYWSSSFARRDVWQSSALCYCIMGNSYSERDRIMNVFLCICPGNVAFGVGWNVA